MLARADHAETQILVQAVQYRRVHSFPEVGAGIDGLLQNRGSSKMRGALGDRDKGSVRMATPYAVGAWGSNMVLVNL